MNKELLFEQLTIAIYRRNLNKIAQIIPKLGIDYQSKSTGQTALIFSLEEASEPTIMKHLIEHYQANPNIVNPQGRTILFMTRSVEDLKYLLKQNMNLDIVDKYGFTALEDICYSHSFESDSIKKVKLLIDCGANYQNIQLGKVMEPSFKNQLAQIIQSLEIEKEQNYLDKAIKPTSKANKIKL